MDNRYLYNPDSGRLFVGYYRVSTQSQGRSGLGLDAQRNAVSQYVRNVRGRLHAEYEEVESGNSIDRPSLQAALKECKARKAVLVIAKLDRLARNLHFITQLMESRVEFIAADMPAATKLTIHIIAAMAEHERDIISQRTKDALRAASRRGVVLGNPGISKLSAKGVLRSQAQADAFANDLIAKINSLQASGVSTYAGIAKELERQGARTQRGGLWTAAGVRNIVLRSRRILADRASHADKRNLSNA